MSSRILAVDTATEACSVALWCDGDIISRFAISPQEHTQKFYQWLRTFLQRQEWG